MLNNILEYYYPLTFPSIKKRFILNCTVVLPLKEHILIIILALDFYFRFIKATLAFKNKTAIVSYLAWF